MDDFVIVLNAGSSSLKFSIYRRPESEAWRLESRGQIEGIGTSPRFSAKDGSGTRLVDNELDKEKVGVMPGSSFGEAAAGHIRISLCQPEPVLQEAAMRLRRFVSSYRREAA